MKLSVQSAVTALFVKMHRYLIRPTFEEEEETDEYLGTSGRLGLILAGELRY